MESNFVIKVMYSDTIRRFNVPINENKKLDLDMDALRAKISALFSFPPAADLTLTYVDEDGDIVTLVEDDDLMDVMRQHLKFLMIFAQLSTDKCAKTYARSSSSTTAMRSPRVMSPSQFLNAEQPKSVPDPGREVLVPIQNALSKLALDLGSKVAYSKPVAVELIDLFSDFCISILKQAQQSQGCSSLALKDCAHQEVSPKSETKVKTLHDMDSEVPTGLPLASEPNALKDGVFQEVCPKSEVKVQTLRDMDAENVTRPVGPSDVAVPPLVKSVSIRADENQKTPSKSVSGCTIVDPAPPTCFLPTLDGKNDAKNQESIHPGFKPSIASVSANHSAGRTFPSDCQSSVTPLVYPSASPLWSRLSLNPLFGKESIQKGTVVGLFHREVRCDGCGAYPIVGSRYKSKVKDDYDLCNICFAGMGNEADYIKIERPMTHRYPHLPMGLPENNFGALPITPQSLLSNQVKTNLGTRPARSKLDSCFILDVNVFDGTMMAPSTSFTKIWRMRNNGTVAWPQGTQLVWIGGDKLSNALSVKIEIPENGVAVAGELDIAVDFVSPELPGRYVSYWRMASISGSKFGQRVSVLIHVDTAIKNSFSSSHRGLNFNLALKWSGHRGPEVVDLNAEPVTDDEDSSNSSAALEPLKPDAYEQPKDHNLNFPVAYSSPVGDGVSGSAAPEVPSPVTYPFMNIGKTQSFPAADTATMSKMVGVSGFAAPEVPSTVTYSFLNIEEPPSFWAVDTAAMFKTVGVSGSADPEVPSPVTYPFIIDHSEAVNIEKTLSFPAVDTATISKTVSGCAAPEVPSPVTYPNIIDYCEATPLGKTQSFPAADTATMSKQVDLNFVEGILHESDFSFKQVDNKETLRRNEYNLEQSLNDLCSGAEWDLILEELQEMGFHDIEMNKKLLKKNNGSMKHVVMDLLTGSKA